MCLGEVMTDVEIRKKVAGLTNGGDESVKMVAQIQAEIKNQTDQEHAALCNLGNVSRLSMKRGSRIRANLTEILKGGTPGWCLFEGSFCSVFN